MGYKSWVNGDALTGPDVMSYLMNQAVMTFASAAARDTALTSPIEGMTVYLSDVNQLLIYTGAAWRLVKDIDDGNSDVPMTSATVGISQEWTAPLSSSYGWYKITDGWLVGQSGGTVNGTSPWTNDVKVTNPHAAAWYATEPQNGVVGWFNLVRAAGGMHFGFLVNVTPGIESQLWEANGNSSSFTALQVGDIVHCNWNARVA